VYDPKPTETEKYVSSSVPIKCTKEDYELRVVLEPEPCWTYDVSYTMSVGGDLVVTPAAVPVAEAVKEKLEGVAGGKDNKQPVQEKKETDDKKKEEEKVLRPITPKKSNQTRLRSMEKVEAYIEGLEPDKRRERHAEKGHKHSEKKDGRHKEKGSK